MNICSLVGFGMSIGMLFGNGSFVTDFHASVSKYIYVPVL